MAEREQLGFIGELRRRNVFRVAAAFLAGAWLLLQLVDVLNDIVGLPEWLGRVVLIGLLVGFPIAVIISWSFELTPEGLKRDSEVEPGQSIASQSGRKLDFAIIAALVTALAVSLYANFSSTGPIKSLEATNDTSLSIAVLPFANRSAEEDDRYFVDGVHDDILTQLAKINSLTVTSRTSVERYRNPAEHGGAREIAASLGVRNILEGGVQRAGDRIRINVQLIDVSDDTHLWAETYDREMTASNIFAVQGEIAESVADALRVVLEAAEKEALGEAPTDNLAAYDLYLLGRYQWYQRTEESILLAKQYFEQAIEADPDYVLAHAGLADAYLLLPGYGNVDGAEAFPLAEAAIDKAMSMDDAVSEVWSSLGYLRLMESDAPAAERAFDRALELDDKNATAWQWYSIALNRMRRYDEGLVAIENAYALEPMVRPINVGLANHYWLNGDFVRARQVYERLPLIDDSLAVRSAIKVADMHFEEGAIAKSIALWRDVLEDAPMNQETLQSIGFGYTVLGDFKEARRWFLYSENMNRFTEAMIVLFEAEQDYEGAIVYLEEKLAQYDDRQSFQTLRRLFWISYLAGKYAQAAEYVVEMLAIVNGRFEVGPGNTDQMRTLSLADFLIRYGDEFGLDSKLGEELADETLEVLLALQEQGRQRPITWLSLAAAYAIKGDEEMTLAALNEAVDRGMRKYPYGLEQPVFRDLRDNREFIAIEDRIETLLAEERAALAAMEFAPYTLPDGYQPIPMSREQFQKFLGFYSDGNILMQVYIAEDGSYMAQAGQFPAFPILPYEAFKFYGPLQPDLTAEFFADDDGSITHMIAGPENQKTRFKRYLTPPPAVEMSPDLFDLYKGTYVHNRFARGVEKQSNQDLWSAEFREGDNGEMLIDFDDQPALEIVATSDTEFYIRGFDSRLMMFVNAETGAVERMTLTQDGREMVFERQR